MSEIMSNIMVSAIVSCSASGSIIWLFKSWISERLKKAIEFEYAEKLKAIEFGYDKQLEKMRLQLQNEFFDAKEKLEHDKKIFAKLSAYCDEISLEDFCVMTSSSRCYEFEHRKKIDDLLHHGKQVENLFLNDSLQNDFLKFHTLLSEFLDIISNNFFSVSVSRFMLLPELKNGNDQERMLYKETCTQISKASNEVRSAYTNFRNKIKQTLYL
jgi:hypothetical protein